MRGCAERDGRGIGRARWVEVCGGVWGRCRVRVVTANVCATDDWFNLHPPPHP